MSKTSSYTWLYAGLLIVFSLLLRNGFARQAGLTASAKKVLKTAAAFQSDSKTSKPCSAEVSKLTKAIIPIANATRDKSSIAAALTTTRNFVTRSTQKGSGFNCLGTKLQSLINATKLLIGNLDSSTSASATSAAKPSNAIKTHQVTLMVHLLDSSFAGLAGNIKIVQRNRTDTASMLMDSTGNFRSGIFADSIYQLFATSTGYLVDSATLSISRDSAITIVLSHGVHGTAINNQSGNTQIPVPQNTALAAWISQNILLLSLLALVLIIVLMAAILYVMAVYKSAKIGVRGKAYFLDPVGHLKKNITEKDMMINEINANLEVLEATLLSTSRQSETVQPLPIVQPETSPGSAHYFVNEVLMTAGPRKNYSESATADIDLGEDVCGLINTGDKVALWLMDGTSDLHCLKNPADQREYFSSRLLAQSLAAKLRSAFIGEQQPSFDKLMSEIILNIKSDWLQVINQLPGDEIAHLKTNIASRNFPECATTILAAVITIGGKLQAYRSGDSKMLLFSDSHGEKQRYTETSLATLNAESNDRLFFRLVVNAAGELDILSNEPAHEVVTFDNVSSLVCMSDGVGAATENLLRDEYDQQPDWVRNAIIYQSQGTMDDKTICFVEIKAG